MTNILDGSGMPQQKGPVNILQPNEETVHQEELVKDIEADKIRDGNHSHIKSTLRDREDKTSSQEDSGDECKCTEA